jgi:hypothetical protein
VQAISDTLGDRVSYASIDTSKIDEEMRRAAQQQAV